ncbi:MAG: hypothetical protein IPL79_19060 [Myxococcales bacterium]|nr:hypothetical protein [Myxococcales bacterium]
MSLAAAACTEISGGAVEVSWSLQVPLGAGVSCASAQIERMRLWWDDGEAPAFASWPCTDGHGVTRFEVPAGKVELSMAPECATAEEAVYGTFIAPAPISREIHNGEVVRLDAVVVHVITPVAASPASFCVDHACICR